MTPGRSSGLHRQWMCWLPALLLWGMFATPGAAQSALAPVYNSANGHWYQAVRVYGTLNWHEARAAAEASSYAGYRGYLATINSAEENAFVVGAVLAPWRPFDEWWIGGIQDRAAPGYWEPAGGWRWVSSEPWIFAGWAPGEPNNAGGAEQALEIRNNGTWNDLPEFIRLSGYVVEYGPPPVATVTFVQVFPQAVVGGTTVTGQVTLAAPAPFGGAVLALASTQPGVAVPPSVVTVPTGATAITFPIVTFPVAVPTTVIITAAGFGLSGSATLQVLPASPVSPPGPTIVAVRPLSLTQIELTWTDNSFDETAFEIHRRTLAGDWVWIALVAANTTRFTDHTASPGTTYLYRVRAQNAQGASPWSPEASGTTPP